MSEKKSKPERTVTVRTVKYHTIGGESHDPESEYELPESMVASLVGQGLIVRPDQSLPETPEPDNTLPATPEPKE